MRSHGISGAKEHQSHTYLHRSYIVPNTITGITAACLTQALLGETWTDTKTSTTARRQFGGKPERMPSRLPQENDTSVSSAGRTRPPTTSRDRRGKLINPSSHYPVIPTEKIAQRTTRILFGNDTTGATPSEVMRVDGCPQKRRAYPALALPCTQNRERTQSCLPTILADTTQPWPAPCARVLPTVHVWCHDAGSQKRSRHVSPSRQFL